MPLITQNKKSLYGGVSQQPDDTRLVNQVDEMVNFFPSLEQGLRLRNPSLPLRIRDINGNSVSPTFPSNYYNAYSFLYQKGKASFNDDQYAYLITDRGGLEIIDLNYKVVWDGTEERYVREAILYRDGLGLRYKDASAKQYIETFVTENTYAMTAVKDSVFVVNKAMITKEVDVDIDKDYQRFGYVWIKQNDAVYGWKYGATIKLKKVSDNTPQYITLPPHTEMTDGTDVIAADLASRIDSMNYVSATSKGSIVQIECQDGYIVAGVESMDSFGNTASFGWAQRVDNYTDLPNNMNNYEAYVSVGTRETNAVWFKYHDNKWNEIVKPDEVTAVNPYYMPHIINRVFDNNTGKVWFEVSRYEWDMRRAGDKTTNVSPTFIGERIKDVFFFKNRLGLLSEHGLSLSEVGEYGNFFRTSVGDLLDSDRIDLEIENTSSITLEYAVPIKDSVMLFSNQNQFRFKGGNILSPSSFEVINEFNFELNIDVRPYLMNDRIYFAARRGTKSAIYEMFIRYDSTRESEAVDITSHCPDYVDGHIYNITGSSVNNMLFVVSKADYIDIDNIKNAPLDVVRNTIFVYKYLDNGNQRVQSAWFKWKLNGNLLGGFALERNLYVILDRINNIDTLEWILSTGEWHMDSRWLYAGRWIMDTSTLQHQKQIEAISLEPMDTDKDFLDNYNTPIEGKVDIGRWFYAGGNSSPQTVNGILQLKTAKILCDSNTEFDFTIEYTDTTKFRKIPSKYIANRKAMMFGVNDRTKLGIQNSGTKGVEISTVLFEGNLTRRAKG
jgi:hypothetical protein